MFIKRILASVLDIIIFVFYFVYFQFVFPINEDMIEGVLITLIVIVLYPIVVFFSYYVLPILIFKTTFSKALFKFEIIDNSAHKKNFKFRMILREIIKILILLSMFGSLITLLILIIRKEVWYDEALEIKIDNKPKLTPIQKKWLKINK